ncbi:MAG: hypothetical protein DWB48_08460 [Nitrosomonas sp.]|nr:hypothetical protein [Nitrosomonas sp.]
MGWARTTAFARVYGIGYLFNWGECDNCVNALAYTQFERIDFRDLFTREPERNPRFIVHELGHAFDQKVCAFYNEGAKCADIGNGPIRNRLRTDVETRPYLNRYDDYGSSIDLPGAPAYYGFAGGQNQWQFTSEGQTNFSLYPGEVWADMFLGWVYENLATQRMDYMNEVMPEYLSLFN